MASDVKHPCYGPRYLDALAWAADLHRGQVRKGSTVPYVSHLLTVSALVWEAGGDEDQAIAALLHDAVEDQGGRPRLDEIRQRFGDAVADIVDGCTDSYSEPGEPKKPWIERKVAYLTRMQTLPPSTLLVACADKLHNVGCVIDDHAERGEAALAKFKATPGQTRWYYEQARQIFEERLATSPLTRRYRIAVDRLAELVPDVWAPA